MGALIRTLHHSEYYKYVWLSHVEQYHRLGWMLADPRAIYTGPRGEQPIFLIEWPCSCPVQLPEKEVSNAK